MQRKEKTVRNTLMTTDGLSRKERIKRLHSTLSTLYDSDHSLQFFKWFIKLNGGLDTSMRLNPPLGNVYENSTSLQVTTKLFLFALHGRWIWRLKVFNKASPKI